MKKIISILLTVMLLMLCACSDNNDEIKSTSTASGQTESDNQTTTVSASKENNSVEYISEWGIDGLPENFPPPPEKAHDFDYEHFEADDSYSSDWISIQFTCPQNEIYRFTNDIIKAGYTGGAKMIDAPSKYYKAGFNGAWQNGKNLICVSASRIEENGELTLVIDITECKDNFPSVLTNFFPKFNGFSANSGLFSEYDTDKNRLESEFTGAFGSNTWSWDFGYERAFIGVTEADVDAYEIELVNAGFSGSSATSITDGCTVVSYDLVKETSNGKYLGVFIAYNQILKTMDILYTNDASLLIEI